MLLKLPPAELEDDDWDQIEGAFAPDSIFVPTLKKVRAAGNVPQKAHMLFGGSLVNQGHATVNDILPLSNLPYRLTRFGSWAGQQRQNRELAFVILPDQHLERLRRMREVRARI